MGNPLFQPRLMIFILLFCSNAWAAIDCVGGFLAHSRMRIAPHVHPEFTLTELRFPGGESPEIYFYGVTRAGSIGVSYGTFVRDHEEKLVEREEATRSYLQILARRPELKRFTKFNSYFQFGPDPLYNLYRGILEVASPIAISANNSGAHDAETLKNISEYYDQSLQHTFAGYQGRIDEEIIKVVQYVESQTPKYLSRYWTVLDSKVDIVGTVKISEILADSDGTGAPLFHAFQIRGQTPSKFLAHVKDRKHLRLFELGKYNLSNKGRDRVLTKDLLNRMMRRELLEPSEKGIYAHVASLGHADLYFKDFGFEVIESIKLPDGHAEHILYVDGSVLASKLDLSIAKVERLYRAD